MAQLVQKAPALWETWVRSLRWEDPLEKEKATNSSILAWRIPWTESSIGSQRVGHDRATCTDQKFNYLLWAALKGAFHDGELAGVQGMQMREGHFSF